METFLKAFVSFVFFTWFPRDELEQFEMHNVFFVVHVLQNHPKSKLTKKASKKSSSNFFFFHERIHLPFYVFIKLIYPRKGLTYVAFRDEQLQLQSFCFLGQISIPSSSEFSSLHMELHSNCRSSAWSCSCRLFLTRGDACDFKSTVRKSPHTIHLE